MNHQDSPDSDYYQYQAPFAGLIEGVSAYARKAMFDTIMKVVQPGPDTRIVDVGVTSNQRQDSNFFERLYPYPQGITAVGLEDASFLEQQHPGLKFVQADALQLPFADKSFDVAMSFAVIEHVGSRDRQRQFIGEMCRVAKSIFITTPNRWYPLEFHTLMPFIHWLSPQTFRKLLRVLGRNFYASEDTLNLLDESSLLELLPYGASVHKFHFRLLGPISNLVLYVKL